MKNKIYSLIFTIFSCFQYANAKTTIQYKEIKLGDNTVKLKIIENNSNKEMVFVHVHENEVTSLQAGSEYVEMNGGKLVTLQHTFDGSVNRFVQFTYMEAIYEFDPNRIFTNNGVVFSNSIKSAESNQKYRDKAVADVKNLANLIWKEVKDYNLIISLHNNKNEKSSIKRKMFFWNLVTPDSYNITSYAQLFDVRSESNLSCKEIYINPEWNNSEFFIVTKKQEFDQLSKIRCSVVLQNESPVDDGSMSVYAVKNNKRYINAEAKHGRYDQQKKMLSHLKSLFQK